MVQLDVDALFGPASTFPDVVARERLARLYGLDEYIERVAKMLGILLAPERLKEWQAKHHPQAGTLVGYVRNRPPLIVFAGDVGTGKTELAETIGDRVAREAGGRPITLLPLTLATRGQGRVGEMTQLLTGAFEHAESRASRLRHPDGSVGGGVILLIDEADALAQSREANQMHHEDRAGVNALIRGVDRISSRGLPVAIIMSTNRLGALDPAIRRRAAEVLEFRRPDDETRAAILKDALEPLGFAAEDVAQLVRATGPSDDIEYGYTASDITQRLLPGLVLRAFPGHPITPELAVTVAHTMGATPPFRGQSG